MDEKFEILGGRPHVAVWGAGVHTGKLFERSSLLSYPVKTVVDIDEAKRGRQYFGFTVKNPREVAWDDVGGVVISVPGKEEAVTRMLTEELGYGGIIIRLYGHNDSTPFYHLYDENVSQVRYIGDYQDWDSAREECDGYENEVILDKAICSIGKVLSGEAAWERDSFLFYEKKYTYSICAAILRCALQNKNQGVRVLDIGGALGSTYFQNRGYLEEVKGLEYVVAEQDRFAEYGHENLEDGALCFIKSREGFRDYGRFDIVLMSASLQYIPQYKEILSEVNSLNPRYIILDRVLIGKRNRICKETVPEEIYKSSYPVMIFEESEVLNFFGTDYGLVERDISSVPEEAYFTDGKAESRMFVFQRVEKRTHS
nr:methyltransferase, TIGR04325 family [uncultured Acetatifactor sp.]